MMAEEQRVYGIGRRKTAVAKVLLVSDEKDQTVNGRLFAEYFPTLAMRQMALRPLELTSQVGKFGLRVKVFGGGKFAQADAVRLGIARALLIVDAGFRKQLKDAGLLTRDPRMKERKKPGLKRARRAPQFSKR
jgi:small subunit ribosomal protein S9